MQGEDTRCSVPWAGHDPTPHEPWPARHAKAARENATAPRAAAPNLAIRYRPREDRRPLAGPRPRPTSSCKPTSETFGARSGRGRQGKPRPVHLKRFTGPGRATRAQPPGRPPPEGPEGPSDTAPKLRRTRERLAPWGSRRSPTTRIGTPLPRRERAAFLAEETGGAQAYRTLRAGGGPVPGPGAATATEPRSPWRARRSPGRRLGRGSLPWTQAHGPKPMGPSPGSHPRSPTIRRFRVASKRPSVPQHGSSQNIVILGISCA